MGLDLLKGGDGGKIGGSKGMENGNVYTHTHDNSHTLKDDSNTLQFKHHLTFNLYF